MLLAVGHTGAGVLAVPVLAVPVLTASAAYGVSEAFGWRLGLDRRLTKAPQFYAVIVVATLVGMGINPMTALVITAMINGLLAVPLLVLVMLVSNNREAMGERTNGRRLNLLGWGTTAVMAVAAIALIVITIAG